MNKKKKNWICCICNSYKKYDYILYDNEKYHLHCIKKLKNNWEELKEYLDILEGFYCNPVLLVRKQAVQKIKNKMQELEQGKDE